MRGARTVLLFLGGLLFAAGLVGFMVFARMLERRGSLTDARTDGIVVLTGGADRIDDALRLLEAKFGKRLLISGVNVNAPKDVLKRRWPGMGDVFDCCVDLDFKARNTRENAIESARWAREHGFRSLLLVTAAYHMPRAELEFQAAMPNITILSHHVIPEASRINRWWQDPALARIMAFEYLKFIAASLRISLGIPGG